MLAGDCREHLRATPAGFFRTCITSPPYWGLRDYGTPPLIFGETYSVCDDGHEWGDEETGGFRSNNTPGPDRVGSKRRHNGSGNQPGGSGHFCQRCGAWRGQLGLEPTPDLFVRHLVEIFRGVRRVLSDDGTLWIVIGDTYVRRGSRVRYQGERRGFEASGDEGFRRYNNPEGLKQGDLVGIPWMLALALRDDGWYLRAENIWHKPNAMPESVRSRTTRAHEQVFMLSKSERYYYDHEAVKESAVSSHARNGFARPQQISRGGRGKEEQWERTGKRNKRSVWTINTRQFPGAHFAVFPHALVEPMVLASSSATTCGTCGAPYRSKVVSGTSYEGNSGLKAGPVVSSAIVGEEPTCDHRDGSGGPDWVLDPFCGTGTTDAVALKFGRRFGGVDLSEEYTAMAEREIDRYVGPDSMQGVAEPREG